ncbi:aminoglycoside adenylyltransferase domain-containing protein [uncultured Treponema sp.]|uniref:aminoglycoside adenylyltransferase domain-containing protein n=1 Tax=uncultured Treponema sp. TaxID=162155 RepID=UPI0025CEF3A3|nr:aminoglycoside adenylyltransferase domain-containing protein [uncultured Treponema sp.]
MTDVLQTVTKKLVEQSRNILAENLVGIYLHGSAVMGYFNSKKSDIDLLVVVKETPSGEEKLRFMNMAVELNALAPSKGIEFSIVKKSVCSPFVYPTPFELHFSVAHLDSFRKNPSDYVSKMHGTDKDLATHIMIIRHRGLCLFGSGIADVFADVDEAAYFDSIKSDIEDAEADILKNPVYTTLNLCRVLAYKKEKLILSKKEGGEWGLKNLPEKYAVLIQSALDDYACDSCEPTKFDKNESAEYAKYMKKEIFG